VGIVAVDGKLLNRALIEAGMAWVYEKYCTQTECSVWRRLQEKVKASKVGLWSHSNPKPPWEFRHPEGKSGGTSEAASRGRRAENPSCEPPQTAKTDQTTILHGNIKSHVFHKSTCSQYDCENCRQEFVSKAEAMSEGYRPCGMCRP
jgi:micrococcal nuclease